MKSNTTFRRLVVKPGIPIHVDIVASNFYVDSVSDVLSVAFDEQSKFEVDSGKAFALPENDTFHKITFYNDTQSDVNVSFYAGTLSVSTRFPVVSVKPAPTYIVGYSGTIAASGSFVIPNTNLRSGQPYADKQTKLIISNNTQSSYLYLADDASNQDCGIINPIGAWQIETTQRIRLKSVGTAVSYYVMAFYSLPA